MPIFELDGKKYDVEDKHLDSFATKYPEAYTVGEKDGKKWKVRAKNYARLLGSSDKSEEPKQDDTLGSESVGINASTQQSAMPKITKDNIGSMGFVQDEASALYPMSSTRLQPITSLDGKLRGTEQAEKEFNQAMEEKEIDKYFVPKQMNTADDVYENFATRFTNTQEGVTLNEGIAKKTKEVQDKYLKDYMSSKEFAELSKQYKGDEFQKKANEQFQFMYGDKIENELKPINENYSKAINARYGKQINDELSRIAKNDASTELARISKSTDEALDSVEEQIKKRRRQLRNDNWKPGHPMDVARNDNMLSELNVERSYLSTAQNLNDDSMKVLEAAKKEKDGTFIGGLGRGVADSVFDIDTWTMGITGMVDEMRLNNVLTKSEKGEKLTDAEKNLLDACVNNMAINHYYGSDLGYGYQAGKITGESLPFMLEFLINPVSASGRTLAKRILTWGLKNNIKGMSTKGAKMAARFLGDAIAAGGVTLSSGAGMVGEGTVERLNRNFKFSNDDNGNLVVTNTGEISTGEAFGKSLTSAFLERQSEMIFNAFRPLKGKPVNTLAERMQWHGLAEEQLEEVYNNFMNIPLGEMTFEEATSLEQNLITFLGLAPTQVAFSAVGGVGYAVERYNAKKKIREAYGALTPEQQDKLKKLEELAKDHRNRDIAIFLSETLKDESLTQEQKRAELEYAYNLVVNNAIEEAEEAETQSRVEADNASIDAATDTQTGNYAQVTAIFSDGVGGTKEVVGNVVGWIGDSPIFVADGMENTEENRRVLKQGEWNPETLIARPAEEVKAINEDIIREEVSAQAERESKYAPEVLSRKMEQGIPFETADAVYLPIQPMAEGNGWTVEVQPKATNNKTASKSEVIELTNDEFYDLLQADLEAQEAVQAEIAQSESVGEQVNAPVNTEVNNPMENAESTPMSEEVQSATEEKSTQPVIPTKEDGSIDFVAYGREGTLKTLGEKYGEKLPNKVAVTAKALAEDVVKAEEKLAKAEEAYDNAPIGREQKAEQARDKARQELEEVKKEADYWKAIDEEIKEAQKARETIINPTVEPDMTDEPMTTEEFVAKALADGGIRLTSDSYKKELGYGEKERKRFPKMFAKKENGGLSIEEAGEWLMQWDSENGTNFFDQEDANAGRDALINFLGSVRTWGDITGYIRRNREQLAERESEGLRNEVENAIEANYHMTPEEYATLQEVESVENPFGGLDVETKDAIFVEAYEEYEQSLNPKQNDEGRTSEIAEGNGAVLSEERIDNEGGTSERQGERPDLSEGAVQQNDAAQEAEQVEEPLTIQEGESPVAFAERVVEEQRRKPLRNRANEWAKALGVKVHFIERLEDVENQAAYLALSNGSKVAGWYEGATGEVFLYMPNLDNIAEVDKTYIHEVVAHKGLREMLGRDRFNELCDKVWDMMPDKEKAEFIRYPEVNGDTRAAADEYIAYLAEKEDLSPEEQTIWDSIVKMFRDMLDRALNGIIGKSKLTDNDISDLIKASYANLKSGAELGVSGDGTRFRTLEQINSEFNENLQKQIDGVLPQGYVYSLGNASDILRSAGIPYLPIEMASSRLSNKSNQENHPFELSEITDLPKAIQNPLAVFDSATRIGSNVILTELKQGNKNFVVAIETNRRQGKIYVNSVRSIHPRTTNNIVNWINEGLLGYANKETLKEWLDEKIKTKDYLNSSNPADVRKSLVSAANIVKDFQNPTLPEEKTSFRVVTDKNLIDKLEGEPKIKVYRAMQLIDGKLYPPMSAKVDGKMREPIELGKWEMAEERPDLADEKGYFKLDKGNKSSLKARYNPYIHTSTTPLNDQFSSAQSRPELVTVEVEIPESELTSGYKAEKAKDAVGKVEWKAGVVQGKLSGTRTVILSRYDKPIRIVPDSEVADEIVKMFDGKDITMPSNVVTPSLRAELEKRGVPFVETNNQGRKVGTRFRVTPQQDKDYLEAVNSGNLSKAQQMVDEVLEGAGYTIRGEHGTTHKFTIFSNVNANIENSFGKGFYFTSDIKDAEKNYASDTGADLTNRIELLAERMEYEDGYEDMSYEERKEEATKRLNGGENLIISAAIRMENPCIFSIDPDGVYQETIFEAEEAYDEETDEYSEPEGNLVDFVNSLQNVLDSGEYWGADRVDTYELLSDGYYTADQLKDKMDEMLMDITDEEGNIASSEIFRQALEGMGFDGIIDNAPSLIFKGMGLSRDTKHYIAFSPNQIKQSDAVTYDNEGNIIPLSQRADSSNDDIRFRISNQNQETIVREPSIDYISQANEVVEVPKDEVIYTMNNIANQLYKTSGRFMRQLYQNGTLGRVLKGDYAEIDQIKAKNEYDHAKPILDEYLNELVWMKYQATDAAQEVINGVISDVEYAIKYYKDLSLGKDVWRTEEKPRFRIVEKQREDVNKGVDPFTSKYNSKPVSIASSDMTDEELEKAVPTLLVEDTRKAIEEGAKGKYSVKADKIYIFADNVNKEELEDTLFHENLHPMFSGNPIIEEFYANFKAKHPEQVKMLAEGYEESEVPEEVFVTNLAVGMQRGNFKMVEPFLAESSREDLYNTLKAFGYDYEQERGRRNSERNSGKGSDVAEGKKVVDRSRGKENSEGQRESSREQAEKLRDLFGRVADMGLDGVLGNEAYDRAMMDIYSVLPEDSRKEVIDDAFNHYGMNIAPAVSDYIHGKSDGNILDKIVAIIRNALRKVGFDIDLNGNEVKYLAWRSKKPLDRNSLVDMAEDIYKKYQLKVGEYSINDDGTTPDGGGTRFRRVYHGSGASFDKFDHSFMGTGEGNQSFGWGSYVTDVKEVGEKYAGLKADNSPIASQTLRWLDENPTYEAFITKGEGARRKKTIENAMEFLEDMKKDGVSEDVIKAYEQDLKDAERAITEDGYNQTKENMVASLNRHLYEVEIPDDNGSNYIAWDKMLPKEQAERIKDAIRNSKFFKEYEKDYKQLAEERLDAWTKTNGGRAYKLLGNIVWNEKDLSQILSEAGFAGFKYPTNYFSGGNEDGTNNYVIFNEDDLEIKGHTRFRVANKLQVRDEYEATIRKGGYQAREAVQDAMLSLRRFQELIEKESGKKLKDFENAWMHENRLSSVVQAAIHEMERKFYKPMMESVKKLMKAADIKQEEVADYLMLKHGIERNREMAVRKALTDAEGKIDRTHLEQWYQDKEAIRNDASLDTWRKKQEAMDNLALNYGADMSRDYSGLTSMFDTDDIEECTNRAYDEVEALENAYPAETKALGKAVKAMTQNTLDESFRSGLMDRKVYDELLKDMYDYYIPLRGFEETTSEEVYAYLDQDRGAFNAPLQRAKGRSSKSDNPIAYLKSIAESGIMQGERNKMKQTFLNMVINHPSDLVSIHEGVWVVFNPATGEWEAAAPPAIPNNATPADVEAAMEAWEQQMEQAAQNDPTLVKKVSEAADVPYRVVGNRMNQHQIIVKRLGKSYTLTVNGNPRLAMALNGLTNPNNTSNDGKVSAYVSGKFGALNRFLASVYTTKNPDFVVSNFMRDTFYTNTIVRAKEGNSYANKFHKHYAELLMPGKMISLFKKYEKGTLDMSNATEAAFKDFMMNGGETGYSNLKDLENIKKQIAKDLKGNRLEVVEKIAEKLDILNRAVENTARFAAYLTSREEGRSIAKSVFDAKEISVNFNKKGAGGTFFGMTGQTKLGNLAAMVGAGGRALYVFFNAAIQGTTNLLHVMKKSPKGTSAGIAAMFLMGAVLPFLLDDDEEKDYYDLPEHVRRNHLILPGFGDAWISIPLPIEYRIMYGMGELLTSWRTGHERGSDIGRKMLNLTGQALPLNFLEEGFDAFIPSSLSPLWQVYNNKSWTGLPLYKDNEFNKDDPEYTKAYKNVDKTLYNVSKALYDWTFDEENQEAGINLNPAVLEALARGYFGGFATQLGNLGKTWETIAGEREFDWRSIPIGNRVFKSGDERTKEKRITNEYFENMEKLDFMQSRERTLKKTINGVSVPQEDKDRAKEDYDKMKDTDIYKKYQEFKKKKKDVDKLRKRMKEQGSTEELEKKLTTAQEEANKVVR